MDLSENQIGSSLWNHSTDSQNLGFYQTSVSTSISVPDPSYSKDRNSLGSMSKGGVFLPDFFIDPALSVSCSASGSFNGIANPFDASEFSNSYANASKGMAGAHFLSRGLNTQQPFEDATMPRGHGFHRGEAPDSTNGSGDSSNKKKKTRKGMELDQVQGGLRPNTETANENALTKQKLVANNSTRTNVNSTDGKHANDGSNSPKEDYIHVRARRGQATNSHSLAERVRREKISERMKYLQDLVPGCSKVTGKAVMLDEIINYVQSLQRQVEFLSMKLATVNSRLDFNMDWFVPKYSGGGPSTTSFSQDVMHMQLHPPQ